MVKKLLRKGSASALALTLGLSSLAIGLVSSSAEAKGKDSYSFASCVADKHSANVLIMMDESGSVYDSDPDGLRVEGAEVLIDRIQRVSDVYEAPVNVMLAGFGDNFEERSSGWVELKPKETAGVETLAKTARQFTKVVKNKRETDMLSSLNGATKALADQPADSCKLFIFFKDGVDFQKFIAADPTPFKTEDYKDVFKLLKDAKYSAADSLAEEEICRRGGLADALRGEDNLYTFGVALNPDQTTTGGLEKFRSLVEGGNSCGDLPAKGTFFEVNKSSDLPALFGRALDPSFEPSTYKGEFEVEMKRALTSVNILSSGISTFDTFTIKLPETCSEAAPITIERGKPITKDIGGSVKISAKWAGAKPSKSQTLSISVQHSNRTDDTCWVGTWTINPGSQTSSELYFDADLSAVAKFASEGAVLVKGSDGTASEAFTLEVQRPSDKSVVPVTDFDKDLDFRITGFLRDATTKAVVPSSWDGYVVTKANIEADQSLAVTDIELGDYELVLTMTVSVKGFSENLTPISTQQLVKIGTPSAAPTISGVTDFENIDGANRKRGSVTFVGSKDADFEISIANKDTKVNATRFPKNLDYEMFLPEGVSDNIRIPKGQTVVVDIEIAVKLAEGATVNAQGEVSGDLIFVAKAIGVNQEDSKVEGKFVATQLAEANAISQLLWTIFFMIVGLVLPLVALVLITVLLSRFPNTSVSGLPQAAAFNVTYSNGQVTNASELTQQASDLRNFPYIDVAQDRKSATVGFNTFKVKVNPFGLKAVSYAEVEGSSAIGENSIGDGKPYMSINLVSEWIFLADTGAVDLFADSVSGSGTVILVVSLNPGAASGPELMADFLRTSSDILRKLPQKSAAGILGDDSSGFDFGNPSQKPSGNTGNDGFVGI